MPMRDAGIWTAGNILLPLFPVLMAALVQKVAGRKVTVHGVLEDGVLFFYAATVAAVFLFDLFRWMLTPGSGEVDVAVIGVVVGVFVLLLATCGFSVAALGRAGVLDMSGQPVDLRWLSRLSWILALITAILCVVARLALSMF